MMTGKLINKVTDWWEDNLRSLLSRLTPDRRIVLIVIMLITFSQQTIDAGIQFYAKLASIISTLSFSTIQQSRMLAERKQAEEELIIAKQKSEKSEKYLDSIINNMGDPIFVKDDQSRILLANDAFCSLFELSKDQIIGKTLAEEVTTDEREKFLKIDKQVLAEGKENINEESMTVRGGQTRTISTRKTRFIDNNGGKFLIGAIRDITERKNAEIALQNSKNFAESLIQTANVIVIGIDINGEVVVMNEAAEQITGYSFAELKGGNWFEILVPKDKYPEVWETFINYSNTGEGMKTFENPILTKSGTERYISWQNGVLHEGDQISGTISFGIDITERKLAEEKILDQLSELRRWNEALLNREERVLELKREVNELLGEEGKSARYASAVDKSLDTE